MKTNAQITKLLKTRIKHLSRERDKLRDLLYEIQSYEESASEAIENLEQAVDRLSELV